MESSDFKIKQIIKAPNEDFLISCLLITKSNKLIVGGIDKKIYIYKYNETKGIFDFENILTGHEDSITSLSEYKSKNDSEIILSSSTDMSIKMWDISSLKCINTFKGHKDWIFKIISLPDGRIVSAGQDRTIIIWNEEGNILNKLEGHSECVIQLAALKNNQLVSGSRDYTLKIWDLSNYTLIKTIKDVECYSGSNCLLYKEDSDILLVGGNDVIKIIDLKEGKIIKNITEELEDKGVSAISELKDGSFIIGLDSEKNQLINIGKDYKFKKALKYPVGDSIAATANLNEKNAFVNGDLEGNLILWEY